MDIFYSMAINDYIELCISLFIFGSGIFMLYKFWKTKNAMDIILAVICIHVGTNGIISSLF